MLRAVHVHTVRRVAQSWPQLLLAHHVDHHHPPVTAATELLQVSRSAYYTHRARQSARARQDAELVERIAEATSPLTARTEHRGSMLSCVRGAGSTPASGLPG
jgi:hypothetical protein